MRNGERGARELHDELGKTHGYAYATITKAVTTLRRAKLISTRGRMHRLNLRAVLDEAMRVVEEREARAEEFGG